MKSDKRLRGADSADAAAILAREVRTMLQTQCPDFCITAEQQSWGSEFKEDASSCNDANHKPQANILQSARKRRCWRAGVIASEGIFERQDKSKSRVDCDEDVLLAADAAFHSQVGHDATSDTRETHHVPLLPLKRIRHRWRKSVFRRSLIRYSRSDRKSGSKKRADGAFKRLRRISERRLQRDFMSSEGINAPHLVLATEANLPRKCLGHASKDDKPCLATTSKHLGQAGEEDKPCLATIIGDAQLPGWSARLILCLGGGALTAKPLACSSRHIAWSLLRDAVQLSAELRPIAQALACASVWGDQEESKFCRVQDSATILSILARLNIRPCELALASTSVRTDVAGVGSTAQVDKLGRDVISMPIHGNKLRRQTKDRAVEALRHCQANLEQVRVQRVGCLLSHLAHQIRALSQRFLPSSPQAGAISREAT